MSIKREIKEIKQIIKSFADAGQYSANNLFVKSLYQQLRELESKQKKIEEEECFEEQFIDGSDVPVSGRYE